MKNLTEVAQEALKLDEVRTPGEWGSMFIGGPLNPEHIDIYTVGLEGSHHIQVAIRRKYQQFKKGDAELIAFAANNLAKLAQGILDAEADFQSCLRGSEHWMKKAKELEAESQKLREEIELERKICQAAHDLSFQVTKERDKLLEANRRMREALMNWLKWEDEQIEKEGPYCGMRINELIAAGKAALNSGNGEKP